MSNRITELKEAFDFFMNFPNEPPDRYQAKITEIKTAPKNDFYIRYHQFLTRLTQKSPNEFRPIKEIVVSKDSILSVLQFFESKRCLAIKICFGLDRYKNIQMVVSGSFMVPENNAPRPSYVDRIYQKKVRYNGAEHIKRRYYLNFERIVGRGKVGKLLNKFATAIKPQKLHGYMMDIDTFRYFMEDDECLGKEELIKFRFGMNDSGNTPSSIKNAHVMMIGIGSVNEAVNPCIMYICDTAIKNDSDPTLCPPREPCNGGGR